MTEKEKLIARLLEQKHINFEQALLLLEKEVKTVYVTNDDIYKYPFNTPYYSL